MKIFLIEKEELIKAKQLHKISKFNDYSKAMENKETGFIIVKDYWYSDNTDLFHFFLKGDSIHSFEDWFNQLPINEQIEALFHIDIIQNIKKRK